MSEITHHFYERIQNLRVKNIENEEINSNIHLHLKNFSKQDSFQFDKETLPFVLQFFNIPEIKNFGSSYYPTISFLTIDDDETHYSLYPIIFDQRNNSISNMDNLEKALAFKKVYPVVSLMTVDMQDRTIVTSELLSSLDLSSYFDKVSKNFAFYFQSIPNKKSQFSDEGIFQEKILNNFLRIFNTTSHSCTINSGIKEFHLLLYYNYKEFFSKNNLTNFLRFSSFKEVELTSHNKFHGLSVPRSLLDSFKYYYSLLSDFENFFHSKPINQFSINEITSLLTNIINLNNTARNTGSPFFSLLMLSSQECNKALIEYTERHNLMDSDVDDTMLYKTISNFVTKLKNLNTFIHRNFVHKTSKTDKIKKLLNLKTMFAEEIFSYDSNNGQISLNKEFEVPIYENLQKNHDIVIIEKDYTRNLFIQLNDSFYNQFIYSDFLNQYNVSLNQRHNLDLLHSHNITVENINYSFDKYTNELCISYSFPRDFDEEKKKMCEKYFFEHFIRLTQNIDRYNSSDLLNMTSIKEHSNFDLTEYYQKIPNFFPYLKISYDPKKSQQEIRGELLQFILSQSSKPIVSTKPKNKI